MYCRGADLLLFLTDNKELINRKHADALDNPIETKADAEALCAKLIQYGFLYKAEYRPVSLLLSLSLFIIIIILVYLFIILLYGFTSACVRAYEGL